MTELLNREIVRHILGGFGMVPPPNFGKVGISSDEYKLSEGFDLEFESNDGRMDSVTFGLWCGKTTYQGSELKVLGTDVCDNKDNYHEFSVVYKVNNEPIHCLKHVYGTDDVLFMVNINDAWVPTNLAGKLMACAGFERLKDMGVGWIPDKEIKNELFSSLMEVVEM